MTTKVSLRSLFESHRGELEQKLKGFSLPKDASAVQQTIAGYMNEMFDSEGEFRQNLTQSEDYVLQAALSLLNAQQEIANTIDKSSIEFAPCSEHHPELTIDDEKKSAKEFLSKSTNPTWSILGSGGGALVGNLLWKGWGGVFGAIAGTAIAIYLSSNLKSEGDIPDEQSSMEVKSEVRNTPIDTDAFCSVVSGICDSVDNLISTFRSQINRVVNKYESQEKPTIERDYRFLIESIQTLLGFKRTHDESEEKYTKKLQGRIEDLAESLENFDLAVVDYDGTNDIHFEMMISTETAEKKMVYPAIVKKNQTILKGKVMVPNN